MRKQSKTVGENRNAKVRLLRSLMLISTYGTAQVQGNVRTRLKRVLTASETRLPRV